MNEMSLTLLQEQKAVLFAFTAFLDAFPSNVVFKSHVERAEKDLGAYVRFLNHEVASVSDADLVARVLKHTGLDKIDLEGDGDTDNTGIALAFLKSNAGDRVGAILKELDWFSRADIGPGADFAKKVLDAFNYSSNPANTTFQFNNQAKVFELTTGRDKITGSSADDLFDGWFNTFGDGDVLDGGAGNDTVRADFYDQDAATAVTKNIEHIQIRSQYKNPADSSDNNMRETRLDAERMKDVTNWENNNSRSDLLIEDVRINKDQITKDITITMRETDSGHVDYGVYFDQYSLRNTAVSTSRINIQILDTRATLAGENNLKDNASWKMSEFRVEVSLDGGKTKNVVALSHPDMQTAVTVDEMRAALEKAVAAQFPGGEVSVVEGAVYKAVDTHTGKAVSAKEISIIAKGNVQFFYTPSVTGWKPAGIVAVDSGLHTFAHQNAVVNTDLVTSTVVLDDVGRGSTGGDLVIGGLSVGDTSTSKGVGRFEITVEDDSVLRKISSTNDTLQEVAIKNGAQDRPLNAYNPFDKAAGKLVVKGDKAPNTGTTVNPDPKDATLPGGSKSEYGFQDVRLIDGSEMTGKLEFNAEITQNAVDKYLKLRDTQLDPKDEDIAVEYKGGVNNDTMWVNVNQVAVRSNSKINPGKADFSFKFEGGKGDDTINVAIDRAVDGAKVAQSLRGESKFKTDVTGFDVIEGGDALEGGAEVWYHNQRSNGRDRFELNGGEGNDFIVKPGAGDTTIKAGTGADVVFADNTGAVQHDAGLDAEGNAINVYSKAVWGFNTHANLDATDPLYEANAIKVTDVKALALKTVGSWGFKVKVNYRGLESQEIEINDVGDFKADQLDINQAIKKAINDDAVLSKLLVAVDGPGTSLFVQSKVDGVHTERALSIDLVAPPAASVSQEVVDAYNQANGTSLTVANFLPTITANVMGTYSRGYVTQMAQDNSAALITGAESVTTSDNRIHPGVDMDTDVLVLGTTAKAMSQNANVLGDLANTVRAVPDGAGTVLNQQNDTVAALEIGKAWGARAEIETDLDVGLAAAINEVKTNAAATTATMLAQFNAAITAQPGTVFGPGAIATALTAIGTIADKVEALVHLKALVTLTKSVLSAADDVVNGYTTSAEVDTAVDAAVNGPLQDAAFVDAVSNIVVTEGLGTPNDELLSSNDTVVFEGAFGHDVIVNFALGQIGAFASVDIHGRDKLDFTALGGESSGFVAGVAAIGGKGGQVVTDGNIQLFNYVKTSGNNPANDTDAKVKELYTDGTPAAIAKEIYIAVDADGTGHVYQVVDGTAANDLQVTTLGTLDLSVDSDATANFNWNMLKAYHFA